MPTSLPEQPRLIRAAQALADGWPQLSPLEERDLLDRLLARVDTTDEAITLQLGPAHLRDRVLGSEP